MNVRAAGWRATDEILLGWDGDNSRLVAEANRKLHRRQSQTIDGREAAIHHCPLVFIPVEAQLVILLEVRAQRVKVTLRDDAPARAGVEDGTIRPLAYCLVRDGDGGEIDSPEVILDKWRPKHIIFGQARHGVLLDIVAAKREGGLPIAAMVQVEAAHRLEVRTAIFKLLPERWDTVLAIVIRRQTEQPTCLVSLCLRVGGVNQNELPLVGQAIILRQTKLVPSYHSTPGADAVPEPNIVPLVRVDLQRFAFLFAEEGCIVVALP